MTLKRRFALAGLMYGAGLVGGAGASSWATTSNAAYGLAVLVSISLMSAGIVVALSEYGR